MGRFIVIAFGLFFFYPVWAGEIRTVTYHSDSLGVEKAAVIWLPKDYTSSDKRFPVIYQLHGWGVTERSWTGQSLRIQDAADGIELQAIIVMPDGDRSIYANEFTTPDYIGCINEQNPSLNSQEPRSSFCVVYANYESYIINDLIPYIDDTFRTIAMRSARAISGESAGGNGAMSLAFRNQDVFSSVVSHSGSLSLLYDGPDNYAGQVDSVLSELNDKMRSGDLFEKLGPDIENWRNHDPFHLVSSVSYPMGIYFDCGAQDEYGFANTALQFHDRLLKLGISHKFHLEPGKHNDEFWRSRAKHGLEFHKRRFIDAGHYIDQ